MMTLKQDSITRNCDESEIYNEVLSLNGKNILELGCGSAEITRAIASGGHDRHIIALEVDELQHQKNLSIQNLNNVSFQYGGAEAIPVEDASQDVIFMFKSLHHVAEDKLEQALTEIHRVLKPSGMAYISEPLFMGNFNDIIRLFHDEEQVRKAAFRALECAVENQLFKLVDEIFFNIRVSFENFSGFENKILNVSHTDHQLADDIYREVKTRFAEQLTESGAHFTAPMRVDLLQKSMA